MCCRVLSTASDFTSYARNTVPMKLSLTDQFVRSAEAPSKEKRQVEIRDASCLGLVLRVTYKGTRFFDFRYRASNKDERIVLGRYPDVGLKEARLKADAMRKAVADGGNPQHHRRTVGERAFARLAERYLNEHAKRHKKDWASDEAKLNKHILPCWGSKDFSKITRADVVELIERIVSAGSPVMANRVQSLVSTVFFFALDAGLVTSHPAVRMKKRGVERAKTRTLTDDEIRFVWDNCTKPPVSREVGLALQLVLVTGCRRSEVSGMTSDELTDDGWLIPETRTKNGRAHYVPLSALAKDIIHQAMTLATADEQRRAKRDGHAVRNVVAVFPGRGGVGSVAGSALMLGMRRIVMKWRERATPHDCRRTVATRMAKAGIPNEIVAAVLGHAPTGVTRRHYNLYDHAPEKRAALDKWGQILTGIIGEKNS
jgi:integrase